MDATSLTLPVEDAPPPPVTRALAFLGPDFTLFLFFLAIFASLAVVYGAHFHFLGEGSIVIACGIGLGLIGVRFAWRAPQILANVGDERAKFYEAAKRILRDWGPLILVVILYENLHAFTGIIRKVPIDDALYALDVRIFGEEPTVTLGRIATPLLTDWFAFAYGLYFVLPMTLATMLSARGRRADFRELATAVVLHMCVGFLFFVIFPAGPPRFYAPLMHGGFDPPQLHSAIGLWEWSQGAWDSANPVPTHSSFPSMHCAIGMMTLLYGWRMGGAVFPRRPKLFFWICVPLVVSLWISTVYLRHHWVPDCIAGMVLGVVCYKITPIVRRRWPGAEAAARS